MPAFLQKEVGVGVFVRLDTMGDVDNEGELPDSQPDSSRYGPLSAGRDTRHPSAIIGRRENCREMDTVHYGRERGAA